MRLFPPYAGPPLIDQICDVANMTRAYRAVRENIAIARRGRSSGTDGVTLRDFDADWPNQMTQLVAELRSGSYRPLPPKVVTIPKKSGGERAITILSIRDRIAQRAVFQVLEPLFDPLMLDCSYGCRPGLSAADAVARVARYAEQGYTWVVDADISSYFDAIDQSILIALLRQRISEVSVLRLVAAWLACGAHTGGAEPLVESGRPPSLVGGAIDLVRQALDGPVQTTPPATPPVAPGDPYSSALWERPLLDGWSMPYMGYSQPWGGGASRLNTLWTALNLARPALDGAQRVLPQLERISGRGALIAGGVAAGALAAYELAAHWPARGARGTAQGGPLSPLLANVYLHPFDLALTSQGLRLVRFMDDFVVLCASREEAERALRLVERQLATLRLSLHPEKTRIVDYREGLDFLGQSLAPRRRGPTLEQGLASFTEADKALRGALRQARDGAKRAGRQLTKRRNGKH